MLRNSHRKNYLAYLGYPVDGKIDDTETQNLHDCYSRFQFEHKRKTGGVFNQTDDTLLQRVYRIHWERNHQWAVKHGKCPWTPITFKASTKTSSGSNAMRCRQRYVAAFKKFAGCHQGDRRHRVLVDTFNKIDIPGEHLGYSDAWCAASVSAMAHSCGYDRYYPLDFNVGTLIAKAKKLGCWVENDAYVPMIGDWIVYDWSDSGYGDDRSGASHVGCVTSVSGRSITVLEGNKGTSMMCAYRSVPVNGRYIRGYIVPKF